MPARQWGFDDKLGIGVNGYGRIARLVLGPLAMAAAAALLLSGCSDLIYPAVHDMPAPRADTTLTPDQVKQATDDLVSQREHLNTEATGPVTPVSIAPGGASSGSQQQKAAAPAQAAATPPPAPTPASDGAMTAGAYAKP